MLKYAMLSNTKMCSTNQAKTSNICNIFILKIICLSVIQTELSVLYFI